MNSPSNELKAMVDAPKHDLTAALVEWGQILNKLKIKTFGFFSGEESPLESLDFQADYSLDKDVIILIHLISTVGEMLGEDYNGNILTAELRQNNRACITDVKFLGENCELQGTWEEVVRKLFEMDQLMLAQVPEVPDDLNQK